MGAVCGHHHQLDDIDLAAARAAEKPKIRIHENM